MSTEPYGTFTIAGHIFACYLPDTSRDPQVWTIVVTKDGQEIRRETIPLNHEPRFGPDFEDVAYRDTRIEDIIKELGLED
jgi:hypothetical protein